MISLKQFIIRHVMEWTYQPVEQNQYYSHLRGQKHKVKGWFVDKEGNRKVIADDWAPENNPDQLRMCLKKVDGYVVLGNPNDDSHKVSVWRGLTDQTLFTATGKTFEAGALKAIAMAYGLCE